MERLGLGIYDAYSIFNSSTAAALYLKNINFKGKVYMIGGDALKAELECVEGIELADGYDHRNKFAMPQDIANEDVSEIPINVPRYLSNRYSNWYFGTFSVH